MMKKLLTGLVIGTMALVASCGPTKPTRKPTIHPIRIEELYRVYRDGRSSPIWDNTIVRMRASSGEYDVRDKEVHLLPTTAGGLIVCEVLAVPAATDKTIIVTGVCRGPVHDGVKRTATTRHYVRIEACTVVTE